MRLFDQSQKFGTEMLEIGSHFGQSTDCLGGLCYNLCNKLWFGCCWAGNGMDFGSTKWNRCLVRGLPTDSPLHGCGTVKNSPGLLVGPKMVHVCCKQNIA